MNLLNWPDSRGWSNAVGVMLALVCLGGLSDAGEPEAGPEEGGLQLRLVVAPRGEQGKEGFDVRMDVANVSKRTITLRGGWEFEEDGSVKDFLEATASIECHPAIAPWMGGTSAGTDERRKSPQPTEVLKAGETLSIKWQTSGRELKNRVYDPTVIQNPTFQIPGLYSVHVTVDVITDAGTVHLRSNEQLVPMGGSRAMPKHTYGQLSSVNAEKKTAVLGLGSVHKVQVGDEFEMPSKQAGWRLTITEVSSRYSEGRLTKLGEFPGDNSTRPSSMHAILRQVR